MPVDDAIRNGHRRRGEVALAVGRHKEALREATLAVIEDPSDASAHALMARTLAALGRHREEVKAADAGLAVNPDAEHLHRLRAHGLNALRKRSQALESAREALRLAPDLAQTHWILAIVLLGLNRLDETHSEAQSGVTLEPDNWEGHALLGDIAIRRREWAIAEEYYRRSLSLEPLHAPVLNALGVALVMQGKEGAGLHAFRASVAVDPRLRDAKRNFWLVVAGSPGLVAADWRRTAMATILIFALGLATVEIAVFWIWACVPTLVALLAWVGVIRRKRRLRLATVNQDPMLRDLLERIQRDATVKRNVGRNDG